MTRTFTLSLSLFKQLKGKNQLRPCRACGKPFKVDDIIVTHRSTKARWYHVECAKKHKVI